jgi:hypothetical protein
MISTGSQPFNLKLGKKAQKNPNIAVFIILLPTPADKDKYEEARAVASISKLPSETCCRKCQKIPLMASVLQSYAGRYTHIVADQVVK